MNDESLATKSGWLVNRVPVNFVVTKHEFVRFLVESFPEKPIGPCAIGPDANTFAIRFIEDYFREKSWPAVQFPDESYLAFEAFVHLSKESRIYYLPAYMRNSIENPYYESGCLYFLGLHANDLRDSPVLTKAVCEFLILSEKSSLENLPGVSWLLFGNRGSIRRVRKAFRGAENHA